MCQEGALQMVEEATGAEWYAIQTKPHKEFLARDALARLDSVQPYLPALRVDPVNPRSRKIRPFFPGYLFIQADLQSVGLTTIRRTLGVVRMLGGAGDQPTTIPANLIEQIRQGVDASQHEEETTGLGGFRHGDRVRITHGPFAGYEGMFDTRLGGKRRSQILIEFLGRETRAEVDARSLEKLS